MATLQEILARAQALREETALGSISPERAGSIMYDTLQQINQMQLEGGSLVISKIYESVAAMQADTAPVSDLTGQDLRQGQLVVIVPSDTSSSDLGSVYRYNGTTEGASSWSFTGKIGGYPMDQTPTQGSTRSVTSGGVYEQITQLGQKVGDFSDYDSAEYRQVAVTPKQDYYWQFNTAAEVSASLYQYVKLAVTPGEKYRISGYNVNSNVCLACVMKDGTSTKARAIYSSSSTQLSGEYTIPEGYDTLYVNGWKQYAVSIEKWTEIEGTAEIAVKEIDTKVGDGSVAVENAIAETGTKTTGKYILLNLTETASADYEFVKLSVVAGEKYYVEGWNTNSNLPMCFYQIDGTSTTTRGLYDASSKGMNGVITIPSGYDVLYVNGNVAQGVPVKIEKVVENTDLISAVNALDGKSGTMKKELAPLFVHYYTKDIAVGDHFACVIDIAKRFNDTNDVVWTFKNKAPTANNFFDLNGVGVVAKGTGKIQDFICVMNVTAVVTASTDFILPICVGAVNNKDGDFPDNTSLFTGGAHGYNNSSLASSSATMRELFRSVSLDGVQLTNGDRKYGNVLIIDVVNNIQGCNTEKEDGTGREIIQQHIRVVIDRKKVGVEVSFTALEAVNIYALNGLGQYFNFPNVRFIGSTTKRGVYVAGQRAVTEDKHTNIVRNFGTDYYFDIEMDRTYGLAQDGGLAEYNAMGTIANKGYFNLIGDTPLSLEEGDMVSFRGSFAFGEIPTIS